MVKIEFSGETLAAVIVDIGQFYEVHMPAPRSGEAIDMPRASKRTTTKKHLQLAAETEEPAAVAEVIADEKVEVLAAEPSEAVETAPGEVVDAAPADAAPADAAPADAAPADAAPADAAPADAAPAMTWETFVAAFSAAIEAREIALDAAKTIAERLGVDTMVTIRDDASKLARAAQVLNDLRRGGK